MEITEIQMSLVETVRGQLRAFCSVCFDDCFVVRNIRLIESSDRIIVAMPSYTQKYACLSCRQFNPVDSIYCNRCGKKFNYTRSLETKKYKDMAHPTNSDFRKILVEAILKEYHQKQNEVDSEKLKNAG